MKGLARRALAVGINGRQMESLGVEDLQRHCFRSLLAWQGMGGAGQGALS